MGWHVFGFFGVRPFFITGTLGARDFSCAVSCFGQVLKSDPSERPGLFGLLAFDLYHLQNTRVPITRLL